MEEVAFYHFSAFLLIIIGKLAKRFLRKRNVENCATVEKTMRTCNAFLRNRKMPNETLYILFRFPEERF